MKKLLLVLSLGLLASCNDLNYDLAKNSELKGSDWQSANVPFDTASFCKDNNISFGSYQTLYSVGITNLNDIKNISQALTPAAIGGEASDPDDAGEVAQAQKGQAFLQQIAQGLKNNEFSSDDILKVRQAAISLNDNGTPNNLAMAPYKIADNGSIFLDAFKEAHGGKSADSIARDSAAALSEENRRNEENNQAQLRNLQNTFNENIKSKYGEDVFNECGGSVSGNIYEFYGADPYAYKGKCVLLTIDQYGNNKIYISSNQMLVAGKFMIISDSHIRLGSPFVAMAIDPIQYKTVLGELKTPVTFKILKQQ